jgi:hypothetical protein
MIPFKIHVRSNFISLVKIPKPIKPHEVTLSDFEIVKPLGYGGFSTVFLGKLFYWNSKIYCSQKKRKWEIVRIKDS